MNQELKHTFVLNAQGLPSNRAMHEPVQELVELLGDSHHKQVVCGMGIFGEVQQRVECMEKIRRCPRARVKNFVGMGRKENVEPFGGGAFVGRWALDSGGALTGAVEELSIGRRGGGLGGSSESKAVLCWDVNSDITRARLRQSTYWPFRMWRAVWMWWTWRRGFSACSANRTIRRCQVI